MHNDADIVVPRNLKLKKTNEKKSVKSIDYKQAECG